MQKYQRSKNIQEQIENILARSVRKRLEKENLDFLKLQEIRLRAGKPFSILYENEEKVIPTDANEKYVISGAEIKETMDYVSEYSLYAYEQEMKQGFITIEGGHRVGIAGKVIVENNKVKNMQYISSINIRVAHEIIGCAEKVLPYVIQNRRVCHTLIISPPRCGKTTLIRDMIRQISNGSKYARGCSVGVVDERSELGGCYQGVAQNDLGKRTDILDCCPKAEGMIMLIRSMSPEVIAVDEVGTPEELRSIEYAMQCGCKMIVSVHGKDMEEACGKPILGEMIRKRRFERYIILNNEKCPGEIAAIYGERGNLLCSGL